MTRQEWVKDTIRSVLFAVAIVGASVSGAAGIVVAGNQHGIHWGFNNCTKCSCPGFRGSGYTCERGGCGHHFDSHNL